MSTSPGFDQGTTNGDDWYPISGGEQDWAYIYTGANEVTIELSFTKFPAASTLPTIWNNNRESMLSYAETVHWGVRGLITSSVSGLPLSAKINVIGPAPSPTPFYQSSVDASDLSATRTWRLSPHAAARHLHDRVLVAGICDADDLERRREFRRSTSLLNVTLVPVDFTPPTVSSWDFDFDAAAQSLRAQFSEDVALSLVGSDLSLLNLTTGSPVESISSLYDPVTNVASFSFAGLLADGNYRATLAAGSVSDGSGNPASVPTRHSISTRSPATPTAIGSSISRTLESSPATGNNRHGRSRWGISIMITPWISQTWGCWRRIGRRTCPRWHPVRCATPATPGAHHS